MANIKSAKKAIKVTKKVTANNHELKAKVKNIIKDTEKAINANDVDAAKKSLKNVQITIDKAQAKGLVKKNTAARQKARLNKKVKEMNK